MQIWPAIDLRDGKCVRLTQGDYDRETVFGDHPAEMAQRWVDLGADRLHLVDLDGARSGELVNVASVQAILRAVDVPCQLGGGIRDEATVRRLLDLGLERLVIGTSAIKDADWFRQVCRKYPQRLALGLDARQGYVATDGWQETSRYKATDLASQFEDEPIGAIIYTDISTDGMLAGPNLCSMAEMASRVSLPVIASGGVTTIDDVAALVEVPVAGCIIGRALYEETLKLPEALAVARSEQHKAR